MQPESLKLLEDIRVATSYLLEKTRGKSVDEYTRDDLRLLRAVLGLG